MANADATITKPAYTFREVARRASTDDPLSVLISQGISAGNSILSDVLSPDATSTASTTSTQNPSSDAGQVPSRPTQSGSYPTGKSTSTSNTEGAGPTAPNAALATGVNNNFDTAQSNNGSNEHLVIILSVVLGLLVIILAGFAIWYCIRKRRKNKMDVKADDGSSLESSQQTKPLSLEQSQLIEEQHTRHNEIPAAPVEMSDTSRKRTSCQYWSPDDVSSSGTPFLTPPLHRQSSDGAANNGLQASSETNDAPISPITPNDSVQHQRYPQTTTEIDSVLLPRLPRRSSRRSRVHYPSAAEMSKFDFGFNNGEHTHWRTNKRPASFLIPRRPVGTNNTRFST